MEASQGLRSLSVVELFYFYVLVIRHFLFEKLNNIISNSVPVGDWDHIFTKHHFINSVMTFFVDLSLFSLSFIII
jgi:hypothetical protein